MPGSLLRAWSLQTLAVVAAALVASRSLAADEPTPIDGRALFAHEWIANDPLAHGDGLGPMYNDKSCAACHSQGGVGGSGPVSKNAQTITFTPPPETPPSPPPVAVPSKKLPLELAFLQQALLEEKQAEEEAFRRREKVRLERERVELIKTHAGFGLASSFIFARHSTRAEYLPLRDSFRIIDALANSAFNTSGIQQVDALTQKVPLSNFQVNELLQQREQANRIGQLAFVKIESTLSSVPLLISERNTPPLFGLGLLDEIPDHVLFEAAHKKYHEFPEITGRVARLKDQTRFGRFGWKAQKHSLDAFVRLAAASELGLHVPGEMQGVDPTNLKYQAPGLDLTSEECQALVKFIASLPVPQQHEPATQPERDSVAAGKKLFATLGCAHCHTPDLGKVTGVYSDLLLHDMGPQLISGNSGAKFVQHADTGSASSAGHATDLTGQVVDMSTMARMYIEGALPNEWRTPPLWGVADSGPYMHDGRAQTLEQAIAWHSGEAIRSTKKYFQLNQEKRQQLLSFLETLKAQ